MAAIIVGAGAGKRFGGAKALACLPDGRRFVDAIARTALDAGCDPIVAVLPPGVDPPAGVFVVRNARPESEQITSLRLGLAQLASLPVFGALCWPVDHPFVAHLSVVAVLDAAHRTNAPVVVPVHAGRRGHPTFFHRDAWRDVMTIEDGGARAVLHRYGEQVAEISVDDVGVLRDINRRADVDG